MIGLPRKLRSGDIRESPIELRTSGNVYHASRTRMQAESQLERRRKLTLQQYACHVGRQLPIAELPSIDTTEHNRCPGEHFASMGEHEVQRRAHRGDHD